jgi:predicted Zn-ribbon and HTH transcriptional regulator
MKIATNRKIFKSTTPTGKLTYRRTTGHLLKLMVPVQRLITRLKLKGMSNGEGNPTSMTAWTVQEDWHIVNSYNALIRGLMNYYSMIDYPNAMRRVYHLLRMSCAKTLSHRHKMGSVAKAFNKYGKNLEVKPPKGTPEGHFFTSSKEKGKSISLVPWDVNNFRRRKPSLNLKDPFTIQLSLRTRSLIDSCCVVCGSPDKIEMHHIRHIKSSSNPDSFAKVIGRLNRNQVPVCRECHWKIHKGQYDQMSLSDLKALGP